MTPAAARRSWLFVVGSMTETFLVYAIVGWFLARAHARRPPVLPRPLVWLAALAICAGAVVLMRRASAARDAAAFQRASVLAMALLEVNAVMGLVLSALEGNAEAAIALAAASTLAALLFVFPPGLAFFRRLGGEPPGAAPPIGPS